MSAGVEGSSPRRGETPGRDHKGWYVPRALPHFDSPEAVQAITFGLADSLPRDVFAARTGDTPAAHRQRLAMTFDAGHGACLLREPAHAEIVEGALLHCAGTRYDLFAWVVMPNHVHALIAPKDGHRLPEIVQAWKSWTAKAINRCRDSSGAVWRKEYFDRFVRDERHFAAAVDYIEQNPMKAGLARSPSDWRFSSAQRGR